MRTPCATVMSTTAARTIKTIRPAIASSSCSVDSQDLNPLAGLDHIVLVVGAGGPDLPADLDLAAVAAHRLEHERRCADQRGGSGPRARALHEVTLGDRAEHRQRGR